MSSACPYSPLALARIAASAAVAFAFAASVSNAASAAANPSSARALAIPPTVAFTSARTDRINSCARSIVISVVASRVVVAFVAFVSTIGDARATPTRPNAHAVSAHSAHSARGAVAIDARSRLARRSRGIRRAAAVCEDGSSSRGDLVFGAGDARQRGSVRFGARGRDAR